MIIWVFNIISLYDLIDLIGLNIILYLIVWILVYSIFSLILNSILFLVHFKRTYWNINFIRNIDIVIKDITKWDKLFKNFFINVTINIFIFIFITLFYIIVIYYLYNSWLIVWFKEYVFIIINIILFLLQILLLNHYRKRMINFDMTYDIVTPWEMFFINQNWFISEVKTIESDIIRTIDWKYWNNFLLGWLDLWTIEIITIWWIEELGTIDMSFINKPEETAIEIKDILLLKNKCKNSYLQKLINLLNINCSNIDSDINKRKLSKFLHENEIDEKRDFAKLGSVWRIELEEVFEKYYNIK